MRRKLIIVLLGLSCLFFLTACGASRGTIKGAVSYKNNPVTHGEVFFRGPDGETRRADIAADGTYQVKGVTYGEVQVSVRQTPKGYQTPAEARKAWKEKGEEMPADYDFSAPKSQLPQKYADLEKSGLTVTVSRSVVQLRPRIAFASSMPCKR